MLIIMLIKALCFIYSQRLLNYLPFNIFNMSVADEGYFRNASCALSSISTFLFEWKYHFPNLLLPPFIHIDTIAL
jgi:hypothetical protein